MRHLPQELRCVPAGHDGSHRHCRPVRDLPQWRLHGRQSTGQTRDTHSHRPHLRCVPYEYSRFCAFYHGPHGAQRAVLNVSQRWLSGTKCTDEADYAYRDQRAVRRLPYGLHFVGDREVRSLNGAHGRRVLNVPHTWRQRIVEADKPYTHHRAVRQLPQKLCRVRAGHHESRRHSRTMCDLPQWVVPVCRREKTKPHAYSVPPLMRCVSQKHGRVCTGNHGSHRTERAVFDVSQRKLSGTKRAGKTGHAYSNDCAMRHLPYGLRHMGHCDFRSCVCADRWFVLNLPLPRRQRVVQAD